MITDLAVMLMTAAVVTILFKRLRLPVILGYILAGFLISPYFPLFFNVENQPSIETWSEIGVVIILFHIGLEFNFHKLAEIGSTALVSAAVKMAGVMAVGYLFGQLIGLTPMSSLFLGAMLSISSTVVIKKCFEELGLQRERYASLVMGSLVMEDVFSIIIMVILSTLSASRDIDGGELAGKLGMMGAYLLIWLILGIYLLPTLLNKVGRLVNDETLVVLALGLCFAMAILAGRLGFSIELGAFLAGSLIAGTVHVEAVERVTAGTKDLFGAVFFLSVGMMVDPSVIVSRWMIILPVAVIAVIAKLFFATVGMILSGQDLTTAVKGGISLAPIGEFSFIIASLGVSLGVMDDYLYPTIVAASILTIVVTPTAIRHSDGAVSRIRKILPGKLLDKIDAYTSSDSGAEEQSSEWAALLRRTFSRTLIYGVIMFIAAFAGVRGVAPALSRVLPDTAAKIISMVLIYAVIAFFLRPMLDMHNLTFTHLWMERRANRPPLAVLVALKVAVAVLIGYYPVARFFRVSGLLLFAVLVILVVLIGRTDFVSTFYLRLETRFLRNLNERLLEEEGGGAEKWLDEDYSIESFLVPAGAGYAGQTLRDLAWGRHYGLYVVKVERGERTVLLPKADQRLQEGDKVFVLGEGDQLVTFFRTLGVEKGRYRTLKEFMASDYPYEDRALACVAIKVRGTEPFCGKPLRQSGIPDRGRCLILGMRKNGLTIRMPDANLVIEKGDILWIIGSNQNVGRLAAGSTPL